MPTEPLPPPRPGEELFRPLPTRVGLMFGDDQPLTTENPIPAAQRIAGGLMLASFLLALGGMFVNPLRFTGMGSRYFFVDGIIGLFLFRGNDVLIRAAIIRAMLGIPIGIFVLAMPNSLAKGLAQLTISVCLLLLLLGEPGRVRTWLATSVFGLYLLGGFGLLALRILLR